MKPSRRLGIVLLTTFTCAASQQRREEWNECLAINAANRHIGFLHVFLDGIGATPPEDLFPALQDGKVRWTPY